VHEQKQKQTELNWQISGSY